MKTASWSRRKVTAGTVENELPSARRAPQGLAARAGLCAHIVVDRRPSAADHPLQFNGLFDSAYLQLVNEVASDAQTATLARLQLGTSTSYDPEQAKDVHRQELRLEE